MAAPVPLIFQEALNVSPTMVEAFQSHKLLPYKARSNLSSIGAMTVAFCVVVRWCWRDGFLFINLIDLIERERGMKLSSSSLRSIFVFV